MNKKVKASGLRFLLFYCVCLFEPKQSHHHRITPDVEPGVLFVVFVRGKNAPPLNGGACSYKEGDL